MTRVLLIGHSGGIGAALHRAWVARGADVVGLSRSTHGFDLRDEACVAAALSALDGHFDIVFVATGALEIGGAEPEKALRQIEMPSLVDQYILNAVGPMLVLKHALRLLPRDRPAHFLALSARVGSIGDNRLGGWYGYRAAKAALNQLLHGASVELARTHRQLCIACLHPGTVATPFTEKYLGRHPAVPADEAAQNLLTVIDGLGPDRTGGFYDYAGRDIPW